MVAETIHVVKVRKEVGTRDHRIMASTETAEATVIKAPSTMKENSVMLHTTLMAHKERIIIITGVAEVLAAVAMKMSGQTVADTEMVETRDKVMISQTVTATNNLHTIVHAAKTNRTEATIIHATRMGTIRRTHIRETLVAHQTAVQWTTINIQTTSGAGANSRVEKILTIATTHLPEEETATDNSCFCF